MTCHGGKEVQVAPALRPSNSPSKGLDLQLCDLGIIYLKWYPERGDSG